MESLSEIENLRLKGHKGMTPANRAFFLFLDAAGDFVTR